MKRVIFMGTPEYAKDILESIVESKAFDVVGVFTQPDKPVGRKKVLTAPITKVYAQEQGIKCFQPFKLRDEEAIAQVKALSADFIVVAAYGQILPKEILDLAPCINLHASVLPAYRGASPIQQALLNDDARTGVTAMLMDVGLDTGDILSIEYVCVEADDNLETLYNKLTLAAKKLTVDVLNVYESIAPVKQNDALSTHCSKITKEDGLVDFSDAKALYNKYRAFTPWPGIYLESGLKLKEITLLETESENLQAGEILAQEKAGIKLACEKGTLFVKTVQPKSKKEMDALAYLNGKRLECGAILS